MSAVSTIARREVRNALSSTWLLAYAAIFTILALALSYLGERNLGGLGFENFSRTTASLLNLCLLLAPLVALLLGSGAIAGERDRGTLAYLLAQPLERWELLLGMYLGVATSIGLATALGFGLAGIWIAVMTSSMAAGTYLLFVGLVLLLVLVMTGIGVVASVLSKTRVQALGLALLVWITAVFFFDLLLVGTVATTSLGGGGLLLALLLNPVEIVRVLAIIHLEPDLQVLGPFGSYLMDRTGTGGATVILGAALAIWIALPLALAGYLFETRDP
jgi:Cu-processing system permease protein